MINGVVVTSSNDSFTPHEHRELSSNRKVVGKSFPAWKKIRGRSLSLGSRHHSGGGIGRCETACEVTFRDAAMNSASMVPAVVLSSSSVSNCRAARIC
jgi:hypothetical protein